MRKLLILFLILWVVLVIVGCGKSEERPVNKSLEPVYSQPERETSGLDIQNEKEVIDEIDKLVESKLKNNQKGVS